MSVGHYGFDDQTPHGRIQRRVMTGAETLLDEGKDLLAVYQQMIDGDGSNISHFDYVVRRFKYGGHDGTAGTAVTDAQRTVAKAAWDEFQSFMSKFTGDGAVSSVNAAMLQAFAKFR